MGARDHFSSERDARNSWKGAVMFEQWTTSLDEGKMVNKPPYPYLVVQRRRRAVVTAGGREAYTHLLVRVWSLIPTVIIVVALLGFAVVCIVADALSFHSGRLAVGLALILAIVPVALHISELQAWFQDKDDDGQIKMSR